MDGLEIKATVEGRLPQGAIIDNAQVVSWINGALPMICNVYPPVKSVVMVEGDLPEDYLLVAEVRDSCNERYLKYSVTPDNKILFENTGEYTVKYYHRPALLEKITETPDVAVVFHMPIVEYCLSKFWETESEGADMGAVNMARIHEERFLNMITITAETLKKGIRVTRRIKAKPWVGGRKY